MCLNPLASLSCRTLPTGSSSEITIPLKSARAPCVTLDYGGDWRLSFKIISRAARRRDELISCTTYPMKSQKCTALIQWTRVIFSLIIITCSRRTFSPSNQTAFSINSDPPPPYYSPHRYGEIAEHLCRVFHSINRTIPFGPRLWSREIRQIYSSVFVSGKSLHRYSRTAKNCLNNKLTFEQRNVILVITTRFVASFDFFHFSPVQNNAMLKVH